MTEQLKPRKRVLDFIADAFDEFFGGQELHRARNALMPPPPPKEQPMNLDDYIFNCPTCYDSQQVRVPASHSYKPCPDCTPKEKPETPARYEMRCLQCNYVVYVGTNSNARVADAVCVGCGAAIEVVTVRRLPSEPPAIIRKHDALPTLRDVTADELEKMGLCLRASQPEPPPTVSGESIPPVLRSLYDAVEGLPRLRDQLHSVERVNMPCMQGGLDLRDAAMQKIASAVAYLWHAAQNERDITPEIDLMVQAITVLQGVKR